MNEVRNFLEEQEKVETSPLARKGTKCLSDLQFILNAGSLPYAICERVLVSFRKSLRTSGGYVDADHPSGNDEKSRRGGRSRKFEGIQSSTATN